MRTSIWTVSLAVVCGVTLGGMSLNAQARDEGGDKVERRDLAAMAKGPAVNASSGNRYVVLPGARAAVAEDKSEEDELALARAGASGQEVLERKDRFVIYRAGIAPLAATALAVTVQGGTLPVLLNTQTGGLAVVTGGLRVKLRSGTPAEVAAAHGLNVDKDFPRLHVAYLAAPENTDLLAAMAALREDARVAEADLEVIEHVRMPQ